MNNFIPYEKLSKKKKRELDNSRRGNWGELNPVTRRPVPTKAYNRSKARKWNYDDSSSVLCVLYFASGFIVSGRHLLHCRFDFAKLRYA